MSDIPLISEAPIFITADGSPTLQWARPDGYTEKMHHSGGALTESLFIYDFALREAMARGWPLRVVSVGLGLGYNEWIALAEMMQSRRGLSGGGDVSEEGGASDSARDDSWKIWSFETESVLKDSFLASVQDSSLSDLDERGSTSWVQIFTEVRNLVAKNFGLSSEQLRLMALAGLESGQFELHGAFPADAAGVADATCVFYDAFSNKMNSELWVESMITSELGRMLAPHAVLSTYAATGALNRALRSLGFTLQDRPGFQGKRESTFAVR